MNVNLIDPYSNENHIIIHTDNGDFYCTKSCGKILRKDENNRMVDVSNNDLTEIFDEWCHYLEKNHDKLSDEFEKDYKYKTNLDSSIIINSLRE